MVAPSNTMPNGQDASAYKPEKEQIVLRFQWTKNQDNMPYNHKGNYTIELISPDTRSHIIHNMHIITYLSLAWELRQS